MFLRICLESKSCCVESVALTRSTVRVTLGHSIAGCLETARVPGVKTLDSGMSPPKKCSESGSATHDLGEVTLLYCSWGKRRIL